MSPAKSPTLSPSPPVKPVKVLVMAIAAAATIGAAALSVAMTVVAVPCWVAVTEALLSLSESPPPLVSRSAWVAVCVAV